MKIASKRGMGTICGIPLRRGVHNYPIDHKDPMTALQLDALRDIGAIAFDEIIDAQPAKDALDDPTQELVVNSTKTFDKDGKRVGVKYSGSQIVKGGKVLDPDEARAKAKGPVNAGKTTAKSTKPSRDND